MAERIELKPLAPREAIEYFRSKGYAPALQRFDYRDHWREEHARNFVVAKAMQNDVLKPIRQRLDEALANGTTLKTFQDELEPELRALGWWGKSIERDPLTGELREVELGSLRRLKVIFDTNMRTSYAAGQWASYQRTKAFLPYLEYRQVQRPNARDAHKPFNGLILPIDHPIWLKIFPPNGWFCGCYTRPLNQRMLDREGKKLTTEAELAEIGTSPWVNPRTGEAENLLDGIDPAFASNPGAAWQNTDDRHAQSSLDLPLAVRSYDRGYVKELAALRMRDDNNMALAYSLRGPDADLPLGMVREDGISAFPFPPAMIRAFNDPSEQLVIVRSTASGTSLDLADLQRFELLAGLTQTAAVSPDGSIFRIARAADQPFPPAQALALSRGLLAQEAARGAEAYGIAQSDLPLIIDHALALALHRSGMARYAAAPSGRTATIFQGAVDLIADLVSLFLRE